MKIIKNVLPITEYDLPNYPFYNSIGCLGLEAMLNRMAEYLDRKFEPEDGMFVGLWCKGSSGIFMATQLIQRSHRDDLRILLIRKDSESSHNSKPFLEVMDRVTHHVIVDDFIQTGTTVTSICEVMVDQCISHVDCLLTGTQRHIPGYIESTYPDYIREATRFVPVFKERGTLPFYMDDFD
jgi:adenine/guanine phosphoribosyltransferase-like PRPP-binding protein